jgi:hypothetical protein
VQTSNFHENWFGHHVTLTFISGILSKRLNVCPSTVARQRMGIKFTEAINAYATEEWLEA